MHRTALGPPRAQVAVQVPRPGTRPGDRSHLPLAWNQRSAVVSASQRGVPRTLSVTFTLSSQIPGERPAAPRLPDAEPTLAKAREFAPGRSHGMRHLCCIFSNEICFKKGPFVYFLKQTKGRGGTLGLTEALGSLEWAPRKARGLRIRRASPGAGGPQWQENMELPARFRVAAKI